MFEKRFKVRFYGTDSKSYPVLAALNEFVGFDTTEQPPAGTPSKNIKLRNKIASHIAKLEKSGPLMPFPDAEKLPGTDSLWALRIIHDKKKYRIIYFFSEDQIILVHALLKKSNKQKDQDIEIAEQRKKEWERRTHE